jgi:hypothetical protein
MRSLVATTALLMLLAPACGDDTTATQDMTMPAVEDMSVPTDLRKLSCGEILTCETTCMDNACRAACVANASSGAQTLIGAVAACLIGVCGPLDGGSGACTIPPTNAMTCQDCLTNSGFAAATNSSAPCYNEVQACLHQ